MTTTPATTDLDTLKALEQAATPAPWRAHHDEGHLSAVWFTPGSCFVDVEPADAALIAAARNALPALLDELAALKATCTCATTYATYEGPEADCPVHGAVRAFNEAVRERDAAREDLAKTRADVEKLTTALDIVALREIRQAADLAIVERERDRLRDSVQRARQEIAALRAAAEANPATTAEPADEPKADAVDGWPKSQDCSIGAHRPCDRDYCRCDCHDAEPAAG